MINHFREKKAIQTIWAIILSHHFTGIFFSRSEQSFPAIILVGFFFKRQKEKTIIPHNYFSHRWKRNISFLRSSTLLLLHRFLKLRAKGWRPQRLRCVVTYPASLIPRTLCEWWAKPFAVIWSHFLCLELINPVAHTNWECYPQLLAWPFWLADF